MRANDSRSAGAGHGEVGYSRAWRLWVIAHAELPAAVATARGSVRAGVLRAVLRCVDDHAGLAERARLRTSTVARETGYSRGHVQRAVAALEELRVLHVARRCDRGTWHASDYAVEWEALAALVPSEQWQSTHHEPLAVANEHARGYVRLTPPSVRVTPGSRHTDTRVAPDGRISNRQSNRTYNRSDNRRRDGEPSRRRRRDDTREEIRTDEEDQRTSVEGQDDLAARAAREKARLAEWARRNGDALHTGDKT